MTSSIPAYSWENRNLLTAHIAQEHAAAGSYWYDPSWATLRAILQTIFALAQPILRCLSLGGGPSKARHEGFDLGDRGFVDGTDRPFQGGRSASRVPTERDSPAQP